MNVRGETWACRAALTTSLDGASLPTNADAPASIAVKIWSSPECMVSITRPAVVLCCRIARMMSKPVPSGSWRSVTTTSGVCCSHADSACADAPGLGDDLRARLPLEGAGQPVAG